MTLIRGREMLLVVGVCIDFKNCYIVFIEILNVNL